MPNLTIRIWRCYLVWVTDKSFLGYCGATLNLCICVRESYWGIFEIWVYKTTATPNLYSTKFDMMIFFLSSPCERKLLPNHAIFGEFVSIFILSSFYLFQLIVWRSFSNLKYFRNQF